jgi:hypothetical protein
MASLKNLALDQGATFFVTLYLSDAADVPLDITLYTLRGQMRRSYYSSDSVALTITSPNPTQGVMNVSLTPTETAALRPGRYVYDIEIASTTAPFNVTRVLQGIITVQPEATKS